MSAGAASGHADTAGGPVSDCLTETDRKALDNPVWSSLTGDHQSIALCSESLRWFPRDYAPFLAVADRSVTIAAQIAHHPDFTRGYFIGVLPDALPDTLAVESRSQVHQMLLDSPRNEELDASGCRPLNATDGAGMCALAGLAFPFFFRIDTYRLGHYFGIFDQGNLVAMAGERMAFGAWREISGVCTHPDHIGRGYARRLTHALLNRHGRLGYRTFLHVSVGNEAALALYQRMHFTVRATLPMAKIV